MIKHIGDEPKSILSDEELEFLANTYLRLQINPQFKKLRKTFRDYINEYLTEELKKYKETKNG